MISMKNTDTNAKVTPEFCGDWNWGHAIIKEWVTNSDISDESKRDDYKYNSIVIRSLKIKWSLRGTKRCSC